MAQEKTQTEADDVEGRETATLRSNAMTACIVVFDDEAGSCVPYGFDDDCEGALCAHGGPVAFFGDRKQAQAAIRISVKYAELCKAQGVPANDDFLGDCRKCVKIRPVVGVATKSK